MKIVIRDYVTADIIAEFNYQNYPKTNTLELNKVLYVVIEDTYHIDDDKVEVYVLKDYPIKYKNLSQLTLRHLLAENVR